MDFWINIVGFTFQNRINRYIWNEVLKVQLLVN